MVASVEVSGAEQLRAVAKRLRAAGLEGRGLKNELARTIRVEAVPLANEVKQKALETLPKGGGLNQWVASGRYGARNRFTGKGVGVRITGAKRAQNHLRTIDAKGIVRHRVFGVWRKDVPDQPVPEAKGFFTDTIAKKAPKFQLAVLVAMRDTVNKIARK